MALITGNRIQASGQGSYAIGKLLHATPWYELYAGRKLFLNFRYYVPEFYEAAEDEQLKVLIRTTPTIADNPRLQTQLEQALAYEALHVLTEPSGWFAQPIDWIVAPRASEPDAAASEQTADATPHRDETAFPTVDTGLLILSRLHGQSLQEWRDAQTSILPIALNLSAKLLDLLQTLVGRGQQMRGFGPGDFLVDPAARLLCTASDRVVSLKTDADTIAAVFPPSRYPARFSAPEIVADNIEQSDSISDFRSDLYAWGATTLFLLTTREEATADTFDPPAVLAANRELFVERIQSCLQREPTLMKMLLPRQQSRTPAQLAVSFVEVLQSALANSVDGRPEDVAALRQEFLSLPDEPKTERRRWWKKAKTGQS